MESSVIVIKGCGVRIAVAAIVMLLASLLTPVSVYAGGDANQAVCPNESLPGFRFFLPDCRAYEMVTPPFKDGAAGLEPKAVSSGGEHVIISSLSSFAGTESDPLNG